MFAKVLQTGQVQIEQLAIAPSPLQNSKTRKFKLGSKIYVVQCTLYLLKLKVPKREIFVTELFILSDPIWIGDLRIEPKNPFV